MTYIRTETREQLLYFRSARASPAQSRSCSQITSLLLGPVTQFELKTYCCVAEIKDVSPWKCKRLLHHVKLLSRSVPVRGTSDGPSPTREQHPSSVTITGRWSLSCKSDAGSHSSSISTDHGPVTPPSSALKGKKEIHSIRRSFLSLTNWKYTLHF